MSRRITLIQGHPDPHPERFVRALGAAYVDGARAAGHAVRIVDVTTLDFPLLREREQWESGPVPAGLVSAQEAIQWAEHLVLLFPLWLGGMPALLKGFLEQIARPGYAFGREGPARGAKLLRGRSARLVVTMGMPALVYRVWFRAHSIKSLERNILGFVGIHPVRETL
ncbi:MAG TPA: NAD(P)H-dependent oxidoreductase, partial [Herpetosiphonaceae bacterium]